MSLNKSFKPISKYQLYDLVNAIKTDIFKTLSCVKVGIIQSYDVTTQTASIQIASKWHNPYSTEDELKDYPLLQQVPVIDLGGSSYIHVPVNIGDECIVLFNDYMLDSWYNTGQAQPVQIFRRHDWSDGIALVGIRSLNKLIKNLTNFLHLHYSDSSYIVVGDTVEVVNEQTNVSGKLSVVGDITGQAKATAEIHSTNGATGSFSNAAGQTLTIVDGIITKIG